MINTAKKMIYHAFSSIFPIREVDSSFLSIVARMLFRLFGYAVIDYGGVKLKVTPHELADRFFLQGLHLNVSVALLPLLPDDSNVETTELKKFDTAVAPA